MPIFIGALAWTALTSPWWDRYTQEVVYGMSVVARSSLQCITPFLLVCLVAGRILQAVRSFWVVGAITFPLIMVSNFILISLPYWVYRFNPPQVQPFVIDVALLTTPYSGRFTSPFTAGEALLTCLVLGAVAYMLRDSYEKYFVEIGERLQRVAQIFLKIIMWGFLPIILLGAVVKLRVDNILPALISAAGMPYLHSVELAVGLVLLFWFILSKGSIYKMQEYLTAFSPSMGVAFMSMSSMITLPVISHALKKKVDYPGVVDLTLPTLSNMHSFGSAIILGSSALLILIGLGGTVPTPSQYLTLALAFTAAKFSMVAIPGGITLVLIPLLEKYVGFTPEMSSLLLMIDLMTDSFATVLNVLANAGMGLVIDKIFLIFNRNKFREERGNL